MTAVLATVMDTTTAGLAAKGARDGGGLSTAMVFSSEVAAKGR